MGAESKPNTWTGSHYYQAGIHTAVQSPEDTEESRGHTSKHTKSWLSLGQDKMATFWALSVCWLGTKHLNMDENKT